MTVNPLINRDFALLSIGQFVSAIGDGIHRVALIWWIYNVTGSPSTTGLLSLASMVPSILLSPYMGVLADRWDRRKIVYWMDFARGAIIAAVAILSFTGHLSTWHLVASSVLVSSCSSLFNPAVSAMIPGLVGMDKLQRAQGALQTMMGMVGIIGPALGGALVATIGYSAVFLMNAISFALSAVSEMFIRYKQAAHDSKRGHFAEMAEAMRFALGMPTIMGILLVFAMMNFSVSHLGSLTLPYLIKARLGAGSGELGFSMTAISIGGIAGSFLMGILKNPKRRSSLITAGAVVMGGFLVSWVLLPQLIWLYIINAAVGFAASLININAGVIFVQVTPDRMMGKLSAFMNSVTQFMAPIGLSLFSLAAKSDEGLIFYYPVVSGVLILSITLGMLAIKGYREL